MIGQLVLFFIGAAIQTVFLVVGLWIMIMIRQIYYQLIGLLGTAALISIICQGLHLVLGHFIGIFLTSIVSAPLVLMLLYSYFKKATDAERKDVYINVAVGYAMVFCVNLLLVGALLSQIRSSAWYSRTTNAIALRIQTKSTPPAASGTSPETRIVVTPDVPHSPIEAKITITPPAASETKITPPAAGGTSSGTRSVATPDFMHTPIETKITPPAASGTSPGTRSAATPDFMHSPISLIETKTTPAAASGTSPGTRSAAVNQVGNTTAPTAGLSTSSQTISPNADYSSTKSGATRTPDQNQTDLDAIADSADGTERVATTAGGWLVPDYIAVTPPLAGSTVPQLAITLTGEQVILSWPTNATSYGLQTTTDLTAGSWGSISNGINTVGANYVFTNVVADNPAFFRLIEN